MSSSAKCGAIESGDTVLDVGCGTGLNFALLADAVGSAGRVIGLDRSPQMLKVAQRRIQRANWSNVVLVRADATDFGLADIGGRPVDAVLTTYAMSLIGDSPAAWARMRAVLKPTARACIVDMQLPAGRARVLAPLARLACVLGGSDIRAHPWTLLTADADADDVEVRSLRGGHIRVVAATLR